MTSSERDNPGVIAPPPLIPLGALVFGLLLDWLLPAYLLTVLLSFTARMVIGTVFVGAGLALLVAAAGIFRRAGTNIPPWKPALALATHGIYGHLRNPMYVGFGLVTAGLAIAFASDWTLVLMIPAALVLHYGVVLREERYLERKFGDDYRRYCSETPRYGMPV